MNRSWVRGRVGRLFVSVGLAGAVAVWALPGASSGQSLTGGAFPGSAPTPTTVPSKTGAFPRSATVSTMPGTGPILGGGLVVQPGPGAAGGPARPDPKVVAEPDPKREVPAGDFTNSPVRFEHGQVSGVRSARLPWEGSGRINADGSPQSVSSASTAWLTKPGSAVPVRDRVVEKAALAAALYGCNPDGSDGAAKGLVSKDRACSGKEQAQLAVLTAEPDTPGSQGTSVEVPALRGALSKVFVNPDGTITVRTFQTPVHMRATNGDWVDANPTVRPDAKGGRGLVADGVDGPTRFSATTGDGVLVGIEPSAPGAAKVGFSLEGAAAGVKAELRGQAVLYRDVLAGVDMQLDQHPDQVKGAVILKRAGTVNVFRFPFDTPPGATAKIDGTNVIITDAKGAQIGVFSTPVVLVPGSVLAGADGTASMSPVKDSGLTVTVETGKTGGLTAVVALDAKWLTAANRKFPVVVDPSLSIKLTPGGSADAMVFEGSDPWHGPNSPQDYLYSFDQDGYLYFYLLLGGFGGGRTRDFFKYDLSAIAGRSVVSAYWTPTGTIYGYPSTTYLVQPVVGAAWTPSTLTWNTQPAVDPAASAYGTFVRGQSGPSTDITSIVRNWVTNGAPNYGFAIKALTAGGLEETGSQYQLFEENQIGWGAQLDVTYSDAASSRSTPISPATAPTSQVVTIVDTTIPLLNATVATPGTGATGPVQYWFRVSATSDTSDTSGGVVASSGWVNANTWTVPSGGLRDGGRYWWSVYTRNNASAVGWTTGDSTRFGVDLRNGGDGPSAYDSVGGVSVNLATGNAVLSASTHTVDAPGGSIGFAVTYNSKASPSGGLSGSYYDNTTFTGPARLVRLDSAIDFAWGLGSPVDDSSFPVDAFSAKWTGTVTVPVTGSYSFGAASDDTFSVKINSTVVSSSTSCTCGAYVYGTAVSLTAGVPATIEVTYVEYTGNASMQLVGKTNGGGQYVVPASWFSAQASALPRGWTLSGGGSGISTSGAVVGNDFVIFDSSGASNTFQGNGTGGYTPPIGSSSVLASSGTGWTLDDANFIYTFNTAGQLTSAVSAPDDRHSEGLQYAWGGSPSRLLTVTDPVSQRSVQLQYGNGGAGPLYNPAASACNAPAGYEAPQSFLCGVQFFDGVVDDLWYAGGQLYAIKEGADYRLSVNFANGQPSFFYGLGQMDAGLSVTNPNWDLFATKPVIDATGRTTRIQGPAPDATQARIGHSYMYTSPTETRVTVDNFGPPSGYARRVLFDGTGRRVQDIDASGAASVFEWDPSDLLVAAIDPAGRKTTTIRDRHGWPIETFGPAPTACFNGLRPTGSCTPAMPHATTTYDGAITGLAVQWWNDSGGTHNAGTPVLHNTVNAGVNGVWDAASPVPGIVNVDNFSDRWTGDIVFPAAGVYTLQAFQDDGVRVYVDDKIVIDSWGPAHGLSPSGQVTSGAAGEAHRIRIDHFELAWGPAISSARM